MTKLRDLSLKSAGSLPSCGPAARGRRLFCVSLARGAVCVHTPQAHKRRASRPPGAVRSVLTAPFGLVAPSWQCLRAPGLLQTALQSMDSRAKHEINNRHSRCPPALPCCLRGISDAVPALLAPAYGSSLALQGGMGAGAPCVCCDIHIHPYIRRADNVELLLTAGVQVFSRTRRNNPRVERSGRDGTGIGGDATR